MFPAMRASRPGPRGITFPTGERQHTKRIHNNFAQDPWASGVSRSQSRRLLFMRFWGKRGLIRGLQKVKGWAAAVRTRIYFLTPLRRRVFGSALLGAKLAPRRHQSHHRQSGCLFPRSSPTRQFSQAHTLFRCQSLPSTRHSSSLLDACLLLTPCFPMTLRTLRTVTGRSPGTSITRSPVFLLAKFLCDQLTIHTLLYRQAVLIVCVQQAAAIPEADVLPSCQDGALPLRSASGCVK